VPHVPSRTAPEWSARLPTCGTGMSWTGWPLCRIRTTRAVRSGAARLLSPGSLGRAPVSGDGYTRSIQDDRPAHAASGPHGSAGVPRKGYRKGGETRERLITTAQEMIYEVRFNRASSREIARRAGVPFGVIQHHFGTFEALLVAAGEQGLGELDKMIADVEMTGETTEEKLTAITDLLWDYFSRPAYISYLEILTKLTRDPATSEETRARLHTGTVALEKSWLQLMRRTFGRDHHGVVLRRMMSATIQGLAVQRWMNPGQPTFAKDWRLLVEATAAYLDSVAATD
jgi:AcrR family transcriptional regulator